MQQRALFVFSFQLLYLAEHEYVTSFGHHHKYCSFRSQL